MGAILCLEGASLPVDAHEMGCMAVSGSRHGSWRCCRGVQNEHGANMCDLTHRLSCNARQGSGSSCRACRRQGGS